MLSQAGRETLVRAAVTADAAGVATIGLVAVPDTYAALCDPAVVRGIVEQSYAPRALEACIERCAASADAHFLVAERGGRVAGFLHYDSDGREPELHRVYVEPGLKRHGVGTALLATLHEQLDPGMSYVLMVVAANRPAVMFYARHGLVEDARVDGVAYLREHAGIDFPQRTPPVPALVLRFTKPDEGSTA